MLSDQQVLSEAVRIVGNHPLGLMTTVDADGRPHARWMGTATADGIRRIYTLSGRNARKIEHVRRNPAVCWVFSSPEYDDVATLYGQARILDAPTVSQAAWDRLANAARDYAMSALSDDANLEFCAVETMVETVELVSPRLDIFHPRVVDLTAVEAE